VLDSSIQKPMNGSRTSPQPIPLFDRVIATHISPLVRGQARRLKRVRSFDSFQEICLEVEPASLVARCLLTSGLDTKAADVEQADPETAQRRAA
jgi:hypothetical protein